MIYLDTHVVVWLYAGLGHQIPQAARARIDAEDVRISPIVALEMALLHEIGRLTGSPDGVLAHLEERIGLSVCDLPFASVVHAGAQLAWTRDPFDRLIVGQAALRGNALISKDHRILAEYRHAMWE